MGRFVEFAAVAPKVAPAHIISHDHDDVCRLSRWSDTLLRQQANREQEEDHPDVYRPQHFI